MTSRPCSLAPRRSSLHRFKRASLFIPWWIAYVLERLAFHLYCVSVLLLIGDHRQCVGTDVLFFPDGVRAQLKRSRILAGEASSRQLADEEDWLPGRNSA
eukprot:1190294-Prorocentrum_minimum.AAC.3